MGRFVRVCLGTALYGGPLFTAAPILGLISLQSESTRRLGEVPFIPFYGIVAGCFSVPLAINMVAGVLCGSRFTRLDDFAASFVDRMAALLVDTCLMRADLTTRGELEPRTRLSATVGVLLVAPLFLATGLASLVLLPAAAAAWLQAFATGTVPLWWSTRIGRVISLMDYAWYFVLAGRRPNYVLEFEPTRAETPEERAIRVSPRAAEPRRPVWPAR